MADAMLSVAVERLAAIVEEQIRKEVNLVRCVKKEISNLSEELKKVGRVLHDAYKKEFQDDSIKDWLKRLEETSYEMDDVLDEWNVALLGLEMEQTNHNVVPPKNKVHSCFPSLSLCFKEVSIRRDIAKKMENVKEKLSLILAEKKRYGFEISQPTDPSRGSWRPQSTSEIYLEEVFGRKVEGDNLVSKLEAEQVGIRAVSIVGEGGLGKTTLAQLAYNDSRVKNCFELRIWICVSDLFDEVEIAKRIIEGVGGSRPSTTIFNVLLERVRESISGKKFLLVLDDVWSEDDNKWEPLKNSLRCGRAGSKILVTTRNKRVAIIMGSVPNEIHELGILSDEVCWSVLSRSAFLGKSESEREREHECKKFENIGKKIANKCKGLPLAAKTLGGLLRFKNTLLEWENVLNSEIWGLEEVQVKLFPHLLLSYNELSPALKKCFSYCSVFPKDTEIKVEIVITQWMALGYLGSNQSSAGDSWEDRGREYFHKIAMRSLFQDFQKVYRNEQIESFKMHDILHDFAQFLRKNGGVGAETTCETCSALLVSHVREYHRSLIRNNELPPHLCDCLKILRLLKLRDCKLESIPKEIEKLIHLRWLDVGDNKFSSEDVKNICKLYNLQFLWLDWCELEEIPREIGNLIHLKHLDLSRNKVVKELPESLCGLSELESLNVRWCEGLCRLPQGINRLKNLKHLHNIFTYSLKQFPTGIAELTSLRTLMEFHGGSDWSKLAWLKSLNRLSGSLDLKIQLSGDDWKEVVEDGREAELRSKMHIQTLRIEFCRNSGEEGESVVLDALEPYHESLLDALEPYHESLLDALEPHPNLQHFELEDYCGSQLPGWIASPVNQLRSIELRNCSGLLSLWPLPKLPFLEEVLIVKNSKLELVGGEFLGIRRRRGDMDIEASSSSSSSSTILFPKLEVLKFHYCPSWKEWEDITAEEEDSALVSIMPCLTKLKIALCGKLRRLPHRLLRKVSSSLEELYVRGSTQLQQVYGDKEGEGWKSISHNNPRLKLTK